MNAPDLRTRPPRRWSAAVDGVVWLPRLIDKARAYDAGTLGGYLYGQSPVDDAFLRRAGLDYAAFLAIVRRCADDAEVLREIERATPGATERLRGWGARLPQRSAFLIKCFDIDEGYERAWWTTQIRAIGNAVYAPLAPLLRALRPLPK